MAMTVTFQGGTRFDLTNGRHVVVADQPKDEGGEDAGMSPVELFVGSVAACVGYFIARYYARHGLSSEGLRIDAGWSYAERPHRVGSIQVHVHLPKDLPQEHHERLLKVAHGCTVHQSIAVPAEVRIVLDHGRKEP